MPNVIQDNTDQYQVLDPALLGRPVHLLPQFAVGFSDALGSAMQAPAWRRYWGGFRIEAAVFGRGPDTALRWLGVPCAHGSVAVAFERGLLLGLLDRRYSRRGEAASPRRDGAAERITATEERLAVVLTQQVAEVLYARVVAALAAGPAAVGKAAPVTAPGRSATMLRVVLRDAQSELQGQFWIAPDQQLMAALLQGLLPERGAVRPVRHGQEALASNLQLRIEGRLVSKEIMLATLFELNVGDVIPVSVGRADVLLDEARLFTAAVAEHKGKLCLTSFEDAE
jgi:flagellar motor switch protein FliM